jgi:hypothetical protein
MSKVIKLRGFGERPKALPVRVLLHKDGTPVKIGDTVTDFRGDTATVTGWKHDGQNKMFVKWNPEDTYNGEYYPTVFSLKWADQISD